MRKIVFLSIILLGLQGPPGYCPEVFSQQLNDVTSEHLLLRIPKEIDLLGRQIITDLERFYRFLEGALDAKLPEKIILLVDRDLKASRANYREISILIGMDQPVFSSPKTLLLNECKRELARLGLFQHSRGTSQPDYEFMYEGMIEILVREFDHRSRSLDSAWVIAQFLDAMGGLGLEFQRQWADFSGGRRSMRNAAPGITLLLTFREMEGRQSPIKFFQTIRRANLSRSLKDAFKKPAPELETAWRNKVREFGAPEEITVSADDAPRLGEIAIAPDALKAGDTLELGLQFQDNDGDLLADGVFVRDERTGKIFQAQADSDPASVYILGKIPIEADCAPGEYGYQVTAIDESGNLRRWRGAYTVTGGQ
ncbi:MAG: hypothetical protein JW793_05710 [Acidobacteria bacterium]|nr:hypothetical protein [Acidobacteriota bacterium]